MIEEYDIIKIREAKKILDKVNEYYYCDPQNRQESKRLDTICIKLAQLLEIIERKKDE